MTYYVVCGRYPDKGPAKVYLVGTIEADNQPEATYKECPRYDLYVDYFTSRKEALQFIKESV